MTSGNMGDSQYITPPRGWPGEASFPNASWEKFDMCGAPNISWLYT